MEDLTKADIKNLMSWRRQVLKTRKRDCALDSKLYLKLNLMLKDLRRKVYKDARMKKDEIF